MLTVKRGLQGEKIIRAPNPSVAFAEFLGALNGDGHVTTINYVVCFISHKILDRDYLCHRIAPLFRSLFAIKPSYITQRNCLRVTVGSKQLVFLLHTYYNIPLGKKTHKLTIPNIILENKHLQLSYLRGLFDTDGTFYGRRDNEPVIGFTSLSPKYLESVQKLLQEHNFNFGLTGKDLYLYRKDEINRFFNEVKPANEKHLIKYRLYLEKGIILKTDELLQLLLRR